MNALKKYTVTGALSFFILIFSGCSDFLNINEDPNNPTSATVTQLMPTVQIDLAGAMGMSISGLSSITSIFTHQVIMRGNLQDYAITGDEFGVLTPWNIIFPRLLTDIREIIQLGTQNEDWHYVGIAQIMRAYVYSILVDVWGDVPFEDAIKGAGLRSPSFDSGEDIYPKLFELLDEGMENLTRSSNLRPGQDDIIYNGDLDKWRKFAKTLKLKMYNQIRNVQNVSDEVNELLTEADLLDEDSEFQFPYGTRVAPSTRNPAYVQEYASGAARYNVSPYFVELLSGKNSFFPHNLYDGIVDPRIPYYFYNQLAESEDPENTPAYRDGRFISVYMFSYNIDPNEGFDQSASQTVVGLYPVGGRYDNNQDGNENGRGVRTNLNGAGDTPQRLLTFFARKYIEAELALMGVSSGDARALLEESILASFRKLNQVASRAGAPLISADDIDEYINSVLDKYDDADVNGKLEHIITQKWIASYGFGVDSYTDYRRTGFPILHDGNTDNLDVTVRTRDYPHSFPWPTSELQVNANAPSQKNVVSNAARVFWARSN
ncbi:MAG: SusD/RagB family nutrient-binding outer membrane lipoprotein [Cyclobacteriaceae bacterium]